MELPTTLPVEQVVREIKTILSDSLSWHSSLRLEKVELSLKTLDQKTVPLVNFTFGGGSELKEEYVQTLNLTLVPPAVGREATRGIESASIQQRLVERIEALARLVEGVGQGEPKLAMSSRVIELNFILTSEGKVSLIPRASGKKALTHTIKFYIKGA